jgi:hypothetical protein
VFNQKKKKYHTMVNKSTEMKEIIFEEDYLFLRNLLALKKKNKSDIFIGFQVLEKPAPKEIITNNKISYNQNQTDNYAGIEYKLIGWTVFNIFDLQDYIRNGRFTIKLHMPPQQLPPVDLTEVPVQDFDLEFTLLEYEYTEADLEQQLNRPSSKISLISGNTENRSLATPDRDVDIDNRPFIPNHGQQYEDKQFMKGFGIDFYIDGARNLPDNATVIKIILKVINSDYLDQTDTGLVNILPRFRGSTYSPVIDFRQELRSDYFDSTSLVFMTILTIDKSHNEPRVVGHCAINLFVNKYTKEQPTSNNDSDMVLFSGNYEIPIISEEPLRTRPFTLKKILGYSKLPAASLLVRIRLAPLSDDWKRVLSIKDFPRSEWVKRGIWVPKPSYADGVYNNQMIQIGEREMKLYYYRNQRVDPLMRETAFMLAHADKINKNLDDEELYDFCDKKITLSRNTLMLDPLFFAKYQPDMGFKFVVDGVHNCSDDDVLIGKINNSCLFTQSASQVLFRVRQFRFGDQCLNQLGELTKSSTIP